MKYLLIQWTSNRPWQAVAVALVLSLIMASGVRYIHIEDDIMRMLPSDLPSRLIWDEIEASFGSTEPLLVTIGQESTSIYNKASLAAVWDLTRALEQLEIVDEVQSLATMNRLESVDGFLEVANLMPARELTPEELADVKRYVEENPDISGMLVSPAGDFTMLAVVPTTSTTDAELAQRVLETNAALEYGIGSYVSGMPYIRGVLAEVVRSDVLSLMRIGMLVLVLILLINLRSPAGLLMVLAVIVLSAPTGWADPIRDRAPRQRSMP